MKALHFDSVGGASGDMTLAALIELGVPPEAITAALRIPGLEPLTVEARPHAERGLHGTRVAIRTSTHAHADDHAEHAHRHLADIEELIGHSPLPEPARRSAAAVFRRLAEAEAAVHGTTVEAVHFHEVGALDSIADILGSCFALHCLGVDAVSVSPLPTGTGTIHCAHGVLPNPGPATMELLKGHPLAACEEPFELVTPTGAALLTTWRNRPGIPDGARVERIGHGFGHRTLQGRPNLLRAVLLDGPEAAATAGDLCAVLETNLDDTTPELIGALVQKLLAAGAFDVFTTAVQMKKQRPGVQVTVLCDPAKRESLLDLLFAESTTFGVREHLTRRTLLERSVCEVATPYGTVRAKTGVWKGRAVTRAPEYEDCRACAERHSVPVRAVYEAAMAALHAGR
jgi:uncharacterized protein (TIGR00299 family) protein